MSVKIRLRRMGAKKRPFYRLVVADARSPRDGRFIESIGTYDPLANPAVLKVDADRVKEWMGKGARPTDTARQLLVAEGLLERSTREYPQVEKKPKLNKKAIARAQADASAPPPAEQPAVEESAVEESAESPAPEAPAPEAEAAPGAKAGDVTDASAPEAEAVPDAEASATEVEAAPEAEAPTEEPDAAEAEATATPAEATADETPKAGKPKEDAK